MGFIWRSAGVCVQLHCKLAMFLSAGGRRKILTPHSVCSLCSLLLELFCTEQTFLNYADIWILCFSFSYPTTLHSSSALFGTVSSAAQIKVNISSHLNSLLSANFHISLVYLLLFFLSVTKLHLHLISWSFASLCHLQWCHICVRSLLQQIKLLPAAQSTVWQSLCSF